MVGRNDDSEGSASTSSFTLNLAASIVTCVTNVVAFNPLDCLRVRWQAECSTLNATFSRACAADAYFLARERSSLRKD